jgi:hypothetical protein
MTTEIKTWEIIKGELCEVRSDLVAEGRTEPYDLEKWIASRPEILGSDIAIIGRQVTTRSGPIDLFGIDRNGNTVIVELKRDKLPREALAQSIDYAANVAEWDIDRINEISLKYTGKNLEDLLSEEFDEKTIENLNINQTQRILLVGFSIEDSLDRMVAWLSNNFSVNVNAIVLHYAKTSSGTELLSRTTIIPEEVERERVRTKKFTIPMSDEPGNYDESELKEMLENYFSQNLKSARRIKEVLLPVCLKKGVVTRERLKKAFIEYKEPNAEKNAGYFMSLISVQIGVKKNDFLRQIIAYEYPNNPWEKDNYRIREGYEQLARELIES